MIHKQVCKDYQETPLEIMEIFYTFIFSCLAVAVTDCKSALFGFTDCKPALVVFYFVSLL